MEPWPQNYLDLRVRSHYLGMGDSEEASLDENDRQEPDPGYNLTDNWLRERMAGEVELDLPALTEATWPDWEAALLSADPAISGPARLILWEPVGSGELDHYLVLADHLPDLIRIWEKTGEESILGGLIGLLETTESGPGLDWLLEMTITPRADNRVVAHARSMDREVDPARVKRIGGLTLARALKETYGRVEELGLRQVVAVSELRRIEGGAGQRVKTERLKGMIQTGRLEEGYRNVVSAQAPGEWVELAFGLAPGPDLSGEPPEPGALLAWGGWPERSLEFFEKVLEGWARELSRVARITEGVAERTRRPVICLFNANLAASLGWALEEVAEEAPPVGDQPWLAETDRIRELWLAGRAVPATLRVLAEAHDGLTLAHRQALLRPLVERAFWLSEKDRQRIGDHPWPLRTATPENLLRAAGRVVTKVDLRLREWDRSIAALSGRLLRMKAPGGDGRARILGLTEKFSASTLAGADSELLAAWLTWLRLIIPEAVFLLFDETRSQTPHLAKVLDRIPDSFGLAPFGELDPVDPVETISRVVRPGGLFALRPTDQGSIGGDLAAWLNRRDEYDLYDPNWKEGLSCLYEGTAQEGLAPPRDRELFPGRVLTETGIWPTGLYFRTRLRAALTAGREAG